MHKSWIAAVPVTAAVALSVAAVTAPPGPAQERLANTHGDGLVPYVGKVFYLSPDFTVATEKSRTAAVPPTAGEFTLSMIGQDFAAFEDRTERVHVPLAVLRVVLRKQAR